MRPHRTALGARRVVGDPVFPPVVTIQIDLAHHRDVPVCRRSKLPVHLEVLLQVLPAVARPYISAASPREAAIGGLRTKIADLDTQQGTSVDWNRTRLNARIQPEVAAEAFATAAQAIATTINATNA